MESGWLLREKQKKSGSNSNNLEKFSVCELTKYDSCNGEMVSFNIDHECLVFYSVFTA